MEDFVPYELAVKLNEAGFNYDTKEVYEINVLLERYFEIPKPTISQVLKWLREEKKIHVSSNIGYTGWFFDIEEILDLQEHTQMYKTLYTDIEDYNTYELAALAGIEYVIDNDLI